MKKIIIIIAISMIYANSAWSQNISPGLSINYYSPVDETFIDIYGTGIKYGGELEGRFWNSVSIVLTGNYYSKSGQLTYTKESSALKIISFDAGFRKLFSMNQIIPYIGAGTGINFLIEKNPIGTANNTSAGYYFDIGGLGKLYKNIFLDLRLNYKYCRIKPQTEKLNIGGTTISLGLKYYIKK